ncbi:MAG TPA: ABC transporter permease subunit [Saprospiraceae bacterium]|nr:ABC transporter permease subunit [Saprospiraceae bacterium]
MVLINKIDKYIFFDILRNKIVILYTLLLAILSWSVFTLEADSHKGVLTLLNVILLTTPLISIIFTTIYLYNSAEFIELLLSQPQSRQKIWNGLFWGLFLSLALSYWIGAGIPIMLFVEPRIAITLLLMGSLITAVFVALGFLSAILTRDKARGIGASILVWLFFSLMFDGLVLFLMFQFADYPIEKAMIGVSAMNPIDLARIFIILQLDVSAMLGYTGAIFKEFFGSNGGMIIGFVLLCLWAVVPYTWSIRKFVRKDL